ncbi:MAG: sensor histidine kinase, partial [Bacteroidota bacterium]
LAFYEVLQFCWWAALLTKQNEEVFLQKTELVKLKSDSIREASDEISSLEKKLNLQKWMIIGEGLVFLSLLLWGSFITYRSFRKEFELARLQKNFLLSVTHEFKSPLASIKLYLETILQRDLDVDRRQKFLTSALVDTDRLDQLVENALMANLVERPEHVFHKEYFNFSRTIRELVDRYRSVPGFPELSAYIVDELNLYGDRNALSILFINLIENAAKYSSAGSGIGIRLEQDNSSVMLSVADQGIGIPDKEKEKVFQKFYRVGNEETRNSKGTGLGLYLSGMIVKKHNGSIKVKDNSPRGSIFEVRLPA